jgi:hypothetical protein
VNLIVRQRIENVKLLIYGWKNILEKISRLPDTDRLSVLAATILLAYALARFIHLPEVEWGIQLPGLYLSITITIQTIVALLVATLTATGMDWLVRDHPGLGKQVTVEHWLLPALTALVIELPLFQLPSSPIWWVSFAFGGGLLILVMVAEYIVVDPEDIRQPAAAAGLTVVSFALFLVLASALRFSGVRLFLVLPALTLACGLVSLRTLHLRLHGQWLYLQGVVAGFVVAQLAAALLYWPLSPVSYGLVLLGPAYSITTWLGNLAVGERAGRTWLEPLIIMALIWGVALWIR